jgi:arylsulfatase A-like enzyme
MRDGTTAALRAALVGALLGGLVGVLEAGLFGLRRYGLGEVVFVGPHVVWMAPTFDVVLFAILGFSGAIASALLPERFRIRATAIGLASFAFLALLLHLSWLSELAAIPVALGFGVQMGRVLERRWDRLLAHARIGVAVLVPCIVLVGAGLGPLLHWREARTLRSRPVAPDQAPNILLLVLDTVRALNLSLYGYPRPTTPHIDSLASRGVVFERAYATASWTLPSHASLFTGLDAHELSTDVHVPLDTRDPTLAERLGSSGYATAGFVANQRYASSEWGLARGFTRYEVYPVRLAELPLNASLGRRMVTLGGIRRTARFGEIVNRKRADRVNRELLAWLERRPGKDRPFFAFLNYYDAHEPYLPPAPYATSFATARPAFSQHNRYHVRETELAPRYRRAMDSTERTRQRDAYDGALRYLDDRIAELLRDLEGGGLLGSTIVIITSDHGEHLGENDRFLHAFDLLAPVLHVPLILFYPRGLPSGARVSGPASLRDLPATIADLTGLDNRLGLPGTSLRPLWSNPDSGATGRPALASFKTGCRGEPRFAVIVARHHYIQDGACGEHLYDGASDPLAGRDLLAASAADSGTAATAAMLRALGRSWLRQRRH